MGSRERKIMALHKLFLEKKATKKNVGNSMSTTYSFDPKKGVLTLFWKSRKFYECKAKLGEAFVVNCDGGKPKVHRIKLPQQKEDLLMWLFDFSKECRAHSKKEFELLLERERNRNSWKYYKEFWVQGNKFQFVLCNRSDCNGVYHMAAYVAPDIEKDDVLGAMKMYGEIRGIYYPINFVKKILKSRFGISEEEVLEKYFF